MATVRIYKVTVYESYRMDECGTRYTMLPWGGDTIDYRGCDDGGVDYVLPDGFEVGENYAGVPMVFTPEGEGCVLENCGNKPGLRTKDGLWQLRRAN